MLYLALLALVYIMATQARPANMSSLKDKNPSSKEENEILPPDHLNGVKMEMDGHLNKDFHQEVFLGKDMEEFEEDSEPRKNRKKLIEIFSKYGISQEFNTNLIISIQFAYTAFHKRVAPRCLQHH